MKVTDMTQKEFRSQTPNKKEIANYWKLPEDTCWGCGCNEQLDRAHLKAKVYGGTNDLKNIILLCRFCHQHVQEGINPEKIFNLFQNKHLPFISIKLNIWLLKAKLGLYPDEITKGLNYSKLQKL